MTKGLGFEKGICLLVGIGSYWAWSSVSMVTASLWKTGTADLSHSAWLTNVVAHCLFLLVLACGQTAWQKRIGKRSTLTAFPALVMGGTTLLAIGYAGNTNAPTVYAGSIMSGAGTAGMLMLWCEPFTQLGSVKEQRVILGGSIVSGILIALLIPNLPDVAALVATIMLPAVTAFCMSHIASLDAVETAPRNRSEHNSAVATSAPERTTPNNAANTLQEMLQRQGLRNVASLFACCFILALPAGLFQNWHTYSDIGSGSAWSTILSCMCMLLVGAICLDYYFMEKRGTYVFSRLAIPLIAGGLLVIPSLTASGANTASGGGFSAGALTLTGYHLFLTYIYTEFGLMAAESRTRAFPVFAWGTAAIDVGLVAGTALISAATRLSPTGTTDIAFGIVYLLLLVGILLFPKALEGIENRERDKAAAMRLQSEGAPTSKSRVGALHNMYNRCDEVAHACGLSEREKDVMEYLLKGRTLQSIANETFLSYNTVKTHVSHIYQKTGVHSRDELIDLLDQ